MKKILVFSGSNSSRSINRKLAEHAGSMIEDHTVRVINLTDYDIPIYSEDREKEGFPKSVSDLHSTVREHSGLVISVPEHNGNPPAFFKNILDWLSRYDPSFLEGLRIFLMSTSPGSRGGRSSLETTEKMLVKFKGEVTAVFSLKFFPKNFSGGITDNELQGEFIRSLETFLNRL